MSQIVFNEYNINYQYFKIFPMKLSQIVNPIKAIVLLSRRVLIKLLCTSIG